MPAKPARERYHHGDVRRALIDAALELIRTGGAEGFTLREAARRIGINHRAAYRHFADKETLLAAVAEQGFWSLVGAAREALGDDESGARAADRLGALARAYVRFAVEHPAHFRVMFGPRLNESGRFPALEVPIAQAFELLKREVQRGIEADVFAEQSAREAALGVWSAMHGLATLIVTNRIPVRRERLGPFVDQLLGPTVRGLAARR